ncbi:hypothetical protein PBY51_024034 [Eleginops maclovinus]|uniref:Uncharacterized protein n=1 Tax=Eleginops maclovinus TaxID=56733 RepID=A0AAN8ANL2_ELEMC|nr:hypothetical protein PBY51_024034 [Eleginops maclovinus]
MSLVALPNNASSYKPCSAAVMKPSILRISSTVGLLAWCKQLRSVSPPTSRQMVGSSPPLTAGRQQLLEVFLG